MAGRQVLSIQVNGDPYEVAARANETLLDLLRDGLGLTGTKRGCDDASCGACTVLVDGRPVLSCIQLAQLCEDAAVTTIEGAGRDRRLRALQEALVDEGGLQCGYCTPGIVLAAGALLASNPGADEEAVRAGLSNNLCRCTGYLPIVAAVRKVAALEGPP
jgi:aerobic-type carbon monoxide dehydrogenase small subunit (CoxS/CutS family)